MTSVKWNSLLPGSTGTGIFQVSQGCNVDSKTVINDNEVQYQEFLKHPNKNIMNLVLLFHIMQLCHLLRCFLFDQLLALHCYQQLSICQYLKVSSCFLLLFLICLHPSSACLQGLFLHYLLFLYGTEDIVQILLLFWFKLCRGI